MGLGILRVIVYNVFIRNKGVKVMPRPMYDGPYPELREELRSIALSNGHKSRAFSIQWGRYLKSCQSVEEIVSRFEKSVFNKTDSVRESDKNELRELHPFLMSRGYYDKSRKQFLELPCKMWNQWSKEGVDTSEKLRRLSASVYGYQKEVGFDIRCRGLLPPTKLISDPLSHIYNELATIAYNNGHIYSRDRVYRISTSFSVWWKQCVDKNLTEEERRETFKKNKFDQPHIKRAKKKASRTDEQDKAKEWAWKLLRENGYTDENKSQLILNKCLQCVSFQMKRWESMEHFQSIITKKYGKPNYKNETILNQILADTEDKWSVLFQNELDEDLFRNTKKRVDFTNLLTDAIGHYAVAVHLVNTLHQDEIERNNQPIESTEDMESVDAA